MSYDELTWDTGIPVFEGDKRCLVGGSKHANLVECLVIVVTVLVDQEKAMGTVVSVEAKVH